MISCHTYLLIMLIFCCNYMMAQMGSGSVGSRGNAMGDASVTFNDVYSVENNQAAMAFLEKTAAGITIQNHFSVNGLNTSYGVFALHLKFGTFGIAVNYFGDADFNQTKIGIGYARKLAENFAIGVMLDYIGTKITELESGTSFTFEGGIVYSPSKQFTAGAKIYNPVRSKIGSNYNDELPSFLNIGFSYQPSQKITLSIQGEQQLTEDLRLKGGIEYQLAEIFFLRAGYISGPSLLTAGAGLKLKDFKMDISSQFHQQLGVTPGIAISYDF